MFPNGEWALLLALLAEIGIFSLTAPNFFSRANFFEIVRFSVELGLIAAALTPVIITGGIDLSAGSTMGLAAVALGALWRDAHWPLSAAAAAALGIGVGVGALNGALISRLKIPALVVTLGSFSLFRGIAEGITHGATNYSAFPPSFLYLGQGYLGNAVPVQVPIFGVVIACYFFLLHRSVGYRTSAVRNRIFGIRRAVRGHSGFTPRLACIFAVRSSREPGRRHLCSPSRAGPRGYRVRIRA